MTTATSRMARFYSEGIYKETEKDRGRTQLTLSGHYTF